MSDKEQSDVNSNDGQHNVCSGTDRCDSDRDLSEDEPEDDLDATASMLSDEVSTST